MKLLDVSKCHEDSPDFRSSLEKMEEGMHQLERQMKRICSLCEERQALAKKDTQLYNELISEFEFFVKQQEGDAEEPTLANLTEVMSTGLRQLVDNRERMFEQINLGMVKPMRHFIDHEIEQVKASQKNYHKVKTEAMHLVEKLSQCKRHETTLMNELSLQVFDSRYHLHKGACNYAMDLNHLHAKKTPDFLQNLVDFMTSQLSYFHLGQVTVADVHPYMDSTYTIMEKLRSSATLQDAQQRTQTTEVLEKVMVSRAKDLALFHTQDLHFPPDTAKSTVMRHLKDHHSSIPLDEKELDNLTEKQSTQERTRNGYLWYAENKTFGTHWTRLHFCIKKGMLVSAESTAKVKVPISLNLNLCSVKPAQVTDTERNFCFKVISPIRTLLLQAESSQDMQLWMEVLQNGITHALHSSPTPQEKELCSSLPLPSPPSSSISPLPSATSSDSPVRPVRTKSKSKANITKGLYAVEGNDVCADCGNSKPKWASINLGVLVCIECSGVHRSLGVYVSQVRSLTLDTLKPEWLEKLKEFGNKNSNAIYEKNLPEDFDREAIRTDEGRQEFITDKYIEMKYASAEDKERIVRERQEARSESVRRTTKVNSQKAASEAETASTVADSTVGGGQSNSTGNSLLTSRKVDGVKQSKKRDSPILLRKKGKEKKEKNGGKSEAGGGRSGRDESVGGQEAGGGGRKTGTERMMSVENTDDIAQTVTENDGK